MQRFRPFLTALLGLTLWVQGLAIAAAPAAMAQATEAASTALPDESMEMPCHGDDPAPSVSPCDCCDGDCANMTGCVVGSFVGAATVLAPVASPAHAAIASRTWSAKTAVSPLPLRPPITSHA